ncbi:hypothetical protein EPH_0073690 [Eimeria praecox]|uniref:Uncharacterized protein n=1 Tax=Eimeria praecox TaxID=51316 RepID=U6H744_9EIME|nr:hypothetical protein EPH_0073690 [Eimeria praecox]
MLYYLFPAVQPRWLVTVAERLEGADSDEKPDIALKAETSALAQDEAEAAGIDAAMETDGATNGGQAAEDHYRIPDPHLSSPA